VGEIAYVLEVVRPKLIWVDESSFKNVGQAAASLGIPASRIALLEGRRDSSIGTDIPTLHTLSAEGRRDPRQVEPFKLESGQSNKTVCAYLSFTSGTTSRPKGVSDCLQSPRFSATHIQE
jgi:4-coumarate--CoA ligase